jgi:3-deoxy-D-manno-octulosonic-acid transferase
VVYFYRLLTRLIRPLYIRFIIHKRIRVGKEDELRVQEKLGVASIPRPYGKLIWIHAASVGETLSILKLVKVLQEKHSHIHLLLTSSTLTSAEIVKHKFPKEVIHQYAPLDFELSVKRFLNYWLPDLAIWVESELWPNTLWELHRRGIPVISLNVRFSPRSLRRWLLMRVYFVKLLNYFTEILVQSKSLEDKLRTLGIKKVYYPGNLKFTSDPLMHDVNEFNNLKSQFENKPLWLAASTHPGEEEIAFKVHKKLKRIFPQLLTIVVPRHPHRGQEIVYSAQSERLQVQQFATMMTLNPDTDIVLVDQIGVLGLFYRLCDIVFVGGSLVSAGGHNIIEPAQAGCAILHGPMMHNFSEILAHFDHFKSTLQVKDEDELTLRLKMLFENHDLKRKYIDAALLAVAEQKPVLPNTLKHLEPYLNKLVG